MKKKTLSLALALVLYLGMMAVPASAINSDADASPGYSCTVAASIGGSDDPSLVLSAQSYQIRSWNESDGTYTLGAAETLTADRVYVLPQGTSLILTAVDKEKPMLDGRLSCRIWRDPDGDGIYTERIFKTWDEGGGYNTEALPADTQGPLVDGKETVTITVENDEGGYEPYDSEIWYWTGGVIWNSGWVDDVVSSGFGDNADETVEISADRLAKKYGPNSLVQIINYEQTFLVLVTGVPAVSAAPTAYASTQNVLVDGKTVEFQCYALKDANGNDTNYIKLRDVAQILNGTAAQFEVTWDGAVNIVTGQSYTANGSEMKTPFSGNRTYTVPTSQTKVNGLAANLDAIILTDDAGNGYTYYKLRDLGTALGFTVDWSADKGIFIETT